MVAPLEPPVLHWSAYNCSRRFGVLAGFCLRSISFFRSPSLDFLFLCYYPSISLLLVCFVVLFAPFFLSVFDLASSLDGFGLFIGREMEGLFDTFLSHGRRVGS